MFQVLPNYFIVTKRCVLACKCMLIKSCGCDIHNNCTCCKDCYKCLQNLYTECCSCVGMCPESIADAQKRSLKSSIEDLPTSIHQLFDVLTEKEDSLHRWSMYSYPIYEDLEILTPDWQKFKKQIGTFQISEEDTPTGLAKDNNEDANAVNCTILYMSECMSMHKCRMTCYSMGASKYRWFHDACCQCVGNTCLSYGKNESKCQNCPKTKVKEEEPESYEIDDEL
ncbi:unnamed protein product [Gordionus sp. m RMFG-2023]|uniref:twisted gastrulation protein homolog 1-A-like isoform X2 n=1 Tax=Gordionus sp. m RMFG-2023 TaxID=3053472 RepID=UPI0030E3258E